MRCLLPLGLRCNSRWSSALTRRVGQMSKIVFQRHAPSNDGLDVSAQAVRHPAHKMGNKIELPAAILQTVQRDADQTVVPEGHAAMLRRPAGGCRRHFSCSRSGWQRLANLSSDKNKSCELKQLVSAVHTGDSLTHSM